MKISSVVNWIDVVCLFDSLDSHDICVVIIILEVMSVQPRIAYLGSGVVNWGVGSCESGMEKTRAQTLSEISVILDTHIITNT